MLLDSGQPGFDGADRARPRRDGHGSGGMGVRAADATANAAAVGGFTTESLLAAIYVGAAAAQRRRRPRWTIAIRNWCGPAATPPPGRQMRSTMRGGGRALARHRSDPRLRLCAGAAPARTTMPRTAVPAPRDSGRSASGRCRPAAAARRSCWAGCYPDQCALFGRACTPRTPVGPCMVSDEGACRIWWAGGVRAPRVREAAAAAP